MHIIFDMDALLNKCINMISWGWLLCLCSW